MKACALMESVTARNLKKLKAEFTELFLKSKTELPLAVLLGALPVWLFSFSEEQAVELLGELLASEQLIKYSMFLAIPYALALGIKTFIRFSFDSSRERFRYIYSIVNETGTGFLTLTRTALGATIGVVVLYHTTDILSGSAKHVTAAYFNIISLTVINCLFALVNDWVTAQADRKHSQNPIQLPRRLR